MNLYVLSDLHIRSCGDPIYRSLLVLLGERARSGDRVILAGDIFELFVGNKKIFVDRYSEFFLELARAGERGVRVHYIEGNHDFWVRSAFRRIPGMDVHVHHFTVELGGKRFYFAHGDTVDWKDLSYHALRGFFRSPLFGFIVLLLPGAWIDWIGSRLSHASRGKKSGIPACLSEGKMEKLRKIYRNYAADRIAEGYDYVVMGHCHDLDEMSFVVGGRPGQYVNVGFPPVHGSFLSWQPGDGKISRERLPEPR